MLRNENGVADIWTNANHGLTQTVNSKTVEIKSLIKETTKLMQYNRLNILVSKFNMVQIYLLLKVQSWGLL